MGGFDRFIETIKLLATAPGEAFRRMPTVGGIAQPLFFAVIVAWIGIAVSAVWSLAFGGMAIPFLSPDQLGAVGAALGMSTAMTIVIVVLAPLLVIITVFIQAAILHLMRFAIGIIFAKQSMSLAFMSQHGLTFFRPASSPRFKTFKPGLGISAYGLDPTPIILCMKTTSFHHL